MSGERPRLSESECAKILELYGADWSMREIAALVGRSYGAVNGVLHRFGVSVRSRGGFRGRGSFSEVNPS